MNTRSTIVTVSLMVALASCGGDAEPAEDSAPATPAGTDAEGVTAVGLATVPPAVGAATIEADPPGLVILDVRTPEEFAEGHIEGAVMLDFYEPSFADDLAELDPTVPYVLYCRSGNRSGQTLEMMTELGFTSVENIDGGIVAWRAAGLPVAAAR